MTLLAVASLVSALADSAGSCSFLDAAQLAKIQAAQVAETKGSVRSEKGFEVRQCFYRLDPFARSVSFEVTRPDPAKSATQSLREKWASIFHDESPRKETEKDKERDEERNEERNKARGKLVPVAGVGEEAFWVPNRASGSLYVLERDCYFRVSVGGGDKPEGKLAKCKSIAQSVLARLPRPH